VSISKLGLQETLHTERSPNKCSIFWLGLLLGVAAVLLYARTLHFGYVNYDDTDYILDNPHVSTGVSLKNALWAVRESYAANWHPLTWMSHMLDCQLFGTNPGPPHVVNFIFHTANSILLFLLLFRMTGLLWQSWITAAFFAFHPLHVESVAWIAERKDVLSAFFFFLCLLCYVRYVESGATCETRHNDRIETSSPQPFPPKEERETWLAVTNNAACRASRRCWYVLGLALFVCGLMSKPMLVTLPFVLLLLDYWPLQRFLPPENKALRPSQPSSQKLAKFKLRDLLQEKIPFFALSAACCVVTFFAQKSAGAVASLDSTPFGARLANSTLAYFCYLGKTFWPKTLFIPYVPDLNQNAALPWIAGSAILVLTALVILIRSRRYLAVGWFWYLGTLAPVIGILKVGDQTMADRYTYIPSVGIFLITTWGCAEIFTRLRIPRSIRISVSIAAICGCVLLSFRQIAYWKNGETLFLHSLAADPTNLVALACLASSYATDPDANVRNGEKAVALATACVEQTHRGEPEYLDILSTAYAETGQFQLALQSAQAAARLLEKTGQPFLLSQVNAHIKCYTAGRAVRSK
jgi:hypothetical protein